MDRIEAATVRLERLVQKDGQGNGLDPTEKLDVPGQNIERDKSGIDRASAGHEMASDTAQEGIGGWNGIRKGQLVVVCPLVVSLQCSIATDFDFGLPS